MKIHIIMQLSFRKTTNVINLCEITLSLKSFFIVKNLLRKWNSANDHKR